MARIGVPRRRLLQGIGATAGLAACRGAPGPLDPTDPGPLPPGELDTIVLVMMENRSFDHVFGSLTLLEGRTDINGLVVSMVNPNQNGVDVPIGRSAFPCVDPDPPHGWNSSRTQFDGGTNLGFVRAYQNSHGADAPTAFPMSYHTREEQPVSYALADAYGLCDRWFSSVLSSTWPNRLYFHAAQSQGVTSNELPPGGPYTARTIWDQLTDAGVDWAYYYSDLPTLALFGARPSWDGHLRFIDRFFEEAQAGTLPAVVCVDPSFAYNDDHPPNHPMLGQMFLGSLYQALAASPRWGSSMMVVTYDEAGGFFDHVPPPKMADDYASTGFDQLGFRVPAFVVGPWVKNAVSSTRFDHTAALRFIQDWFGIDERLTARDAASNDLGELLDLERMATGVVPEPVELPVFTRSEEEIAAECEALGGHTGQPELLSFVQERFPELDRTADLSTTARRFWDRAGDQGLWRPV